MKIIVFTILMIFTFKNFQAQNFFSHDTVLSDFKYFIQLLENTHPDPYTAYGGRVFFYKRVFELEKSLTKDGYTSKEFADTINAFLTPLCDVHTNIQKQNKINGDNRWIPLQLGLATDGLYVNNLLPDQKSLKGSQLISIENIPISKIVEKTSCIYQGENLYGYLGIIKNNIWDINYLKMILPEINDQVTFQIKTVDGIQKDLIVPVLPDSSKLKITRNTKWDGLKDEIFMYYQFIDKENKIMYFNLGTIMDREAFKVMKESIATDITINQLDRFYKSRMTISKPDDINDAIAAIPSLSETFSEMLKEMKSNNSTTLIINLKNNSGGWLPTTFPTLYFLFGDKYLTMDFNIVNYRRLSALYMQKNNMTIDEFNASNNTKYELGDYYFEEILNKSSNNGNIRDQRIRELKFYCDTVLINNLQNKPLYSPQQIFVLTNEVTASAATSYSYYLWKLGAKLVGIPSCQALNTFIEYTPFELPLTKLKGSISNSMRICFPTTDKREKIFYPDYLLNIQDYRKYNFDSHSEVLYILDLLNIDN